MNFDKAIESLKEELIYMSKNKYPKPVIEKKLNILNAIIEEINFRDSVQEKLELEDMEEKYKYEKMKIIIQFSGISLRNLEVILRQPLLFFQNSLSNTAKNSNQKLGQKRFADLVIERDLENQEYQFFKLLKLHPEATSLNSGLVSEYLKLKKKYEKSQT